MKYSENALRVAATKPIAIHRDMASPATVAKRKNMLTEQARQTSTPEHVLAKK